MEQERYEIFYLDGLKPGVSQDQAITHLCELFKVSPARADKMIATTRRVVKKGLTKRQAEQYLVALNRVGMQVEMRLPSSDAETDKAEDSAQPIAASTPPPGSIQKTANKPEPRKEVRAVSGERILPVNFHGEGFEYFKIWIVNIFLTIVTLGIYSAWAKVRNTQYFYGNTEIDGSSFNYTAQPIAILKGRLIAVAFFALYAVVNQVMPLLGLVFFVVLIAFLPWIVVHSLAFNARNSVYRNIPFNFVGSKTDATKTFLLWPILMLPTLGLILPYIWCKQRNYVVNNSAYGTTQFTFSATAGDFYRIFFIAIGALLLGVLLVVIAQMISPFLMILGGPVLFAIYLFMFSYFAAALGNLYFNSTMLAAHGFASQLETKSIAWLYFSNTLAIALTLGLFIPWAQVRMARYRAHCTHIHVQGSLDEFIAAEQKHVSALGEQVGEVFDMGVSVV